MPEPLSTITFTLTRADALAYERLPRPLTAPGIVAFVTWLALAGVAVALLPIAWTGGPSNRDFWVIGAILVAIQYTLALIWLTARDMRWARRRVRRSIETTLTDWGDRFSVSGYGIPRDIAYAAFSGVILTPTHLFLIAADDLLIVPRRASSEDGAIEALAEGVRAHAAGVAASAGATPPIDPTRQSA